MEWAKTKFNNQWEKVGSKFSLHKDFRLMYCGSTFINPMDRAEFAIHKVLFRQLLLLHESSSEYGLGLSLLRWIYFASKQKEIAAWKVFILQLIGQESIILCG